MNGVKSEVSYGCSGENMGMRHFEVFSEVHMRNYSMRGKGEVVNVGVSGW